MDVRGLVPVVVSATPHSNDSVTDPANRWLVAEFDLVARGRTLRHMVIGRRKHLLLLATAWIAASWLAPTSFMSTRGAEAGDASTAAPHMGDAHQDGTAGSETTQRAPRKATSYGLWVLLPAIVTIILAIFTRQVVTALIVGILIGAYMFVPCLPAGSAFAQAHPSIGGIQLAAEKYIMGAILAPRDGFGHLRIMIFTLVIGFMVGVMGRNGGTAGMVHLIAGETESRRRSGLTTWLAGLVVFFDDYANTMIVGPMMRSVFDKVRLSRAKLAYIVDSTAAPVASLALIGTWIGAEIGFINDGLSSLTATTTPAFLQHADGQVVSGMEVFIASLPYRFYPILALFLVFLVVLTGRDFGPMKRAESLALGGEGGKAYEAQTPESLEDRPAPRWWLGLFPILCLVCGTVAVLIVTGYRAADGAAVMATEEPLWQKAFQIVGQGDSYAAIFYGALLAATVAVVLTLAARACSTKDAADAGLDGMSRMFPAIVILILAWALSAVEQDLMLGQIVADRLQAFNFPPIWMPLAIFVSAAAISFATGTSWGTMGILCPMVVTVMAGLGGGLDPEKALTLFYASVGSVLAGAIFGDHCSPISDTTVLSSVASGCRHEEHVWTQLPYALLAAVAAMGFGDVLCSRFDQPWYYGLGGGAVFLVLFVFIICRRPRETITEFAAMP